MNYQAITQYEPYKTDRNALLWAAAQLQQQTPLNIAVNTPLYHIQNPRFNWLTKLRYGNQEGMGNLRLQPEHLNPRTTFTDATI